MARDPVCGMEVDPPAAAATLKYEGTKYHFCSKHCVHAFEADPGKYVNGAARHAHAGDGAGHPALTTRMSPEPAPAPATVPSVQFTCPMHPEIVQAGPSSRPKCAMALAPITVTSAPAAE